MSGCHDNNGISFRKRLVHFLPSLAARCLSLSLVASCENISPDHHKTAETDVFTITLKYS